MLTIDLDGGQGRHAGARVEERRHGLPWGRDIHGTSTVPTSVTGMAQRKCSLNICERNGRGR